MFYKGAGHESFQGLQLVGFVILIAGTLLYNEIIVLPFGGFNMYTKAARAARGGDGLLNGNASTAKSDYMSLSPGAAYDSNRNSRAIERKQNCEI